MKKIKFLFIVTILIFSISNIYATEIKESEDKSYKYISQLYFDETKSCSIEIRKIFKWRCWTIYTIWRCYISLKARY